MHILLMMLISLGVSIFGALIGAGGGFLLVPILYFLFEGSPAEITFISLFAVFVNAISAGATYLRMGRVDVRSAAVFSLLTIPSALAGRWLVHRVDRAGFAPFFGGFLVLVAALLVWRVRAGAALGVAPPPKPHWTRRRLVDRSGHVFEYSYNRTLGALPCLGVGFVSSFFGVGGGIIHVPLMTQALHFPVHIATATSLAVLSVTSLAGLLTDLASRGGEAPMTWSLAAGAGALVGAQIGARLSRRVSARKILYLLVAALLLAGGRLLAQRWVG